MKNEKKAGDTEAECRTLCTYLIMQSQYLIIRWFFYKCFSSVTVSFTCQPYIYPGMHPLMIHTSQPLCDEILLPVFQVNVKLARQTPPLLSPSALMLHCGKASMACRWTQESDDHLPVWQIHLGFISYIFSYTLSIGSVAKGWWDINDFFILILRAIEYS